MTDREEQDIRLECLKLALQIWPDTPGACFGGAKKIYEWVKGGEDIYDNLAPTKKGPLSKQQA